MAVALLVAAGRGTRLGAQGPKAFVRVAGRPMLEWSVEALRATPGIDEVVVALPPGVTAPHGTIGAIGGEQRSHSVRAALYAAEPDDVVLVHDAARPLLTARIASDVLEALEAGDCDAAIAASPLADTVKEGAGTEVVRTLDRTHLWAVQTPQAFPREVLAQLMAAEDDVLAAATDDASLLEAQGGTVRLVPAPRSNFKVTTPEDLWMAEALLGARG